MGAKSRRKGASAEREVAELARQAGFPNARRSAPLQAADGQTAPDVDGTGRLWVEVKRRGRGSMYALAVEATRERAGWIPTLAYREDGGPWLAVVPLEELLKLELTAIQRGIGLADLDGGGGTDAAAEESMGICTCARCMTAGKDGDAPA